MSIVATLFQFSYLNKNDTSTYIMGITLMLLQAATHRKPMPQDSHPPPLQVLVRRTELSFVQTCNKSQRSRQENRVPRLRHLQTFVVAVLILAHKPYHRLFFFFFFGILPSKGTGLCRYRRCFWVGLGHCVPALHL